MGNELTRFSTWLSTALKWLAPLIFGVLMVTVWEVLLLVINPENFLLPRPSEIFSELIDDLSKISDDRSKIWAATKTTGFIMITGLFWGIVWGVATALLVTLSRAANETLTPIAVAINAIPIIAVAPLFNNWLGLTSPRSNQMVVMMLVFFPIFITTARGLTQVDSQQIELMNSYAASKWKILRSVRIPNALPFFFTALKLVAPLSIIAAIVVEYFGGSQNSLGALITASASFADYSKAWSVVVAGSIMGMGLYFVALTAEKITLARDRSPRLLLIAWQKITGRTTGA